ncbi:MAG: NAD(P)H-dependent oxidoreductase [Dehalococcoidia bacterium]|nr:NAD(P)H-dependent oxidoreductase [Dehalococcoidia bacterium]
MAPLRAVAISGSPRSPSKSKALAELLLAQLQRAACETSMIDVATLPAEALVGRASAAKVDAAIAEVAAAQIVVAASPTYRALYTGVLKALFDLMPTGHLAGKVCVPLQTAASPAHFLVIDHGFAPLFASLDGITAPGVYATDDRFPDGAPDEKLRARVASVADAALSLALALAG